MARVSPPATSKDERLRHAVRLAEMGSVDAARDAFADAMVQDPRNLDLAYNLAILEETRGDPEVAAQLYASVLEQKPNHALAAKSLARLVGRFHIEDPAAASPIALRSVLRTEGIAHQATIDLGCRWLAEVEPETAGAIRLLMSNRMTGAELGPAPVKISTAKHLQDGLLLLCLRKGVIKHPGLECFLTAVRAAIFLDCPVDRFADRTLTELALALVVQGWNNDHGWAETAEETAALTDLSVDRAKLLQGDREALRAFLCVALYRPLDKAVVPPLTLAEANRLKPRLVRETIEPQINALLRQHEAAAGVRSLRPLADTTSLKVAGQYEAAPYPRWHSLQMSPAGSLKRSLGGFFEPDRLAFMDGAFDVLVAGCGTGQQALQAASAYGPKSRLLAMDLSRASLGYARQMAERHGVTNVTFLHGDILDAGLLGQSFDIIECVGVLHHMADWRAGWQALLPKLKPGGLMYLGFYSAVSRQDLKALRTDPAYPGPGCSNADARAFRRDLMLRPDTAPGGSVKTSRDFYALNAFRDLVLHESEAHVTLEEIGQFLAGNGLVFRGFTLAPEILADFRNTAPDRMRPGKLADWAGYERQHPRTFDAMYRFWVERGN
jgi:SAM-dependent methyltransferase